MEGMACFSFVVVVVLSAAKAYESLSSLLANYPELLEEFAGFLLPCQALQAGCHLPHQLLHHLRLFLRKLEVSASSLFFFFFF